MRPCEQIMILSERCYNPKRLLALTKSMHWLSRKGALFHRRRCRVIFPKLLKGKSYPCV